MRAHGRGSAAWERQSTHTTSSLTINHLPVPCSPSCSTGTASQQKTHAALMVNARSLPTHTAQVWCNSETFIPPIICSSRLCSSRGRSFPLLILQMHLLLECTVLLRLISPIYSIPTPAAPSQHKNFAVHTCNFESCVPRRSFVRFRHCSSRGRSFLLLFLQAHLSFAHLPRNHTSIKTPTAPLPTHTFHIRAAESVVPPITCLFSPLQQPLPLFPSPVSSGASPPCTPAPC